MTHETWLCIERAPLFQTKKIETQHTTEHIQTIVDQKRFICRGLNY